jgi:hypothetical protein
MLDGVLEHFLHFEGRIEIFPFLFGISFRTYFIKLLSDCVQVGESHHDLFGGVQGGFVHKGLLGCEEAQGVADIQGNVSDHKLVG